ncbi:hypothetical protein NPIL_535031 [Nephila pilipes]|uniref:Uncharacterized protein n=1 Tax=Nephila pilipes TaxID=299642 RepID=A0A8X6Q746_NEPPI|nr:hypothetical protein NPIL_535031 [Nephila pilipes]
MAMDQTFEYLDSKRSDAKLKIEWTIAVRKRMNLCCCCLSLPRGPSMVSQYAEAKSQDNLSCFKTHLRFSLITPEKYWGMEMISDNRKHVLSLHLFCIQTGHTEVNHAPKSTDRKQSAE